MEVHLGVAATEFRDVRLEPYLVEPAVHPIVLFAQTFGQHMADDCPPCCPVAPVMSTVLSALSIILSPVSRDSVHIFCGEQEPKRLLLAQGTVYLARGRGTSGAFPIAFPFLSRQEKLLSLGNDVG